MAKITYADKITLAPQPDIANENKCTADDLNEIKNSVNQIYDNLETPGWTQIGSNSYDTRYNKCGNVVSVQCYSPANTTIAGYSQTVVGTLPSTLKPALTIRGGVYARGNNNIYVQINSTNGNIVIFNWGSAITYTDSGQMAFSITFVL